MSVSKAIGRLGFRKWYERELLLGHAHLVLLLLCTLGLIGSFELYSRRLPLGSQLSMALCAGACVVVGLWALRRYLYLLSHAEFLADQAVCRACGTYARWAVVSDEGGAGLRVRCKGCTNEWHILP